MPGENFDQASEPAGRRPGENAARSYVGIHFTCCEVYSRIYINRDKTAYVGNCPRCTRRIELRVGPEGTSARFFTAG